jgi:hypothetical protein
MATTKRFVAKNGLDNNAQSITNVGVSGSTLTMSSAHSLTLATAGNSTLTVPTGTATLLASGGALGTPTSGTLTNCTGLPISGITGLGTNVGTALAVNVGSSGAFVVNGGALGTPSSGTLTSCTGLPVSTGISGLASGVATFLATPSSANLLAAVTDETGTGALVFASSPTLVTPTLGVASATSVNKVAITAPATSATLTIANGKTLTANNTLTLTGTDASSVAFGAGGTVAYTANKLSAFAATTSAELAGVISDETGTGALVFASSPTLVTPVLGTPSSGTLTSCTGLPIDGGTTGTLPVSRGGTGITSFGTGIATFLTTPTSANLLAAVTDETGTGTLVFSASPTFTGTINAANLTLSGDLTINGSTTTINSTTLTVDDKNIELGSIASPTNTTADGGGITLKGTTDKTWNWVNATGAWTSSEHVEIASGKSLFLKGSTSGTITVSPVAAAGTNTLTIPAVTGTVITTGDTGTVTNTMLAGSIANNKLTNSTISGVALGSNLNALTIGTGLSGTSYNGSSAVTIANTGVTSNVAGTGISVSGATGAVTITNSSPNATHTGDVTGATALTIANDAVTNAKAANMAVNTIKGRISTGTGDPEDLTAENVRTIINVANGATANTGTVTSVATNNGLTGGTITTTGTIGLTGQALALHNLATNGVIARTGAGTVAARTITASTGISVSNGDGVSGNPTITNTGVTSNVAGTGVSVSGATGAVTISIGQAVATTSLVQFGGIAVGTGVTAVTDEIKAKGEITAFATSDARLKENVTPIADALNKLDAIRGVHFDWTAEHIEKRGGEDGYFVRKHDVGVIAQEVESVLPEAVVDRDDGYKAVRYEKLVPLLIEAIKELQAEVAALKKQQ